jgi:hypothetical protein
MKFIRRSIKRNKGHTTGVIHFLCGTDESGRLNRSSFWSMLSTVSTIVLLFIAYNQLHGINETTAAEFSHKIKNDLYTPQKIRLITLFDDKLLLFKSDSNGSVWYEIDTTEIQTGKKQTTADLQPQKVNIFQVDELLQDFEDLSFYEKRGQIKFEYIYDAYAYYIEMLWENPEMQKYIKWQRDQAHNSNSYSNLEKIYNRLKEQTDKEL